MNNAMDKAFEHWVDTFDGGLVVTNRVIWEAAWIAALKEAIKNQGEPVALVTSADNGEVDIAEIEGRLSKLPIGTELFASAPTIPADVAKDAARYRWLRDHCTDMESPSHTWIVEAPGDLWDDAIDEAMLSAAPKGEQS